MLVVLVTRMLGLMRGLTLRCLRGLSVSLGMGWESLASQESSVNMGSKGT